MVDQTNVARTGEVRTDSVPQDEIRLYSSLRETEARSNLIQINRRAGRFAEEYIVDLNASKAAIRAGYSPRTAGQIGYQLLQKPSIRRRIGTLAAKRSERTQITADQVLGALAAIAFADIRDLFDDNGRVRPFQDLPEGLAKAISQLDVREVSHGAAVSRRTIRIRFWAKLKALELLGEHLGLFGGACGAAATFPSDLERRLREARRRASGDLNVATRDDTDRANCDD